VPNPGSQAQSGGRRKVGTVGPVVGPDNGAQRYASCGLFDGMSGNLLPIIFGRS